MISCCIATNRHIYLLAIPDGNLSPSSSYLTTVTNSRESSSLEMLWSSSLSLGFAKQTVKIKSIMVDFLSELVGVSVPPSPPPPTASLGLICLQLRSCSLQNSSLPSSWIYPLLFPIHYSFVTEHSPTLKRILK